MSLTALFNMTSAVQRPSIQILAKISIANQHPNATKAVDQGLIEWFEEWKIASSGIVEKLSKTDSKAFHFSVMVNDNSNRAGCDLLQYTFPAGSWTYDAFMLTCNYQYTNMLHPDVRERNALLSVLLLYGPVSCTLRMMLIKCILMAYTVNSPCSFG